MTDALFTPSPSHRPALPEPHRERWQPLRLGLVELFHYDSEEFWFRDGHLLLRGNNGTGKSKVLSLTLPFLFDAQLRPSRIEPDGDNGNPHEKGRLYWIDDAFGPNQLRSDYIDSWISAIPKVKAAIDSGNRFILTSRNHIWNAAKFKLGTRNHPLLADGRAVVDVGSLSPEEREQIVYNHVKAGNQVRPSVLDEAGHKRLSQAPPAAIGRSPVGSQSRQV